MKAFFLSFVLLLISFTFASAQPYTIQQYLNIKSAGSPTLSPDGKRMAYLTNTTVPFLNTGPQLVVALITYTNALDPSSRLAYVPSQQLLGSTE